MKQVLGLFLLCISCAASATSVTLDFAEFLPGETTHVYSGAGGYIEPSFGSSGDLIEITRSDGGSFALISMEILVSGSVAFDVYGVRPDDSVFDWTSPFGSGDWLNVKAVGLSFIDPIGFGGDYGVDNIVVANVVPIPAAAWMMLSALGSLPLVRRAIPAA